MCKAPEPFPTHAPGDVLVVTPGPMPCDAVLLRGEAIVDESMLTGVTRGSLRLACFAAKLMRGCVL